MTQYEKIKAMSIDEMAELIIGTCLLFANRLLGQLELPQLTEEQLVEGVAEHKAEWIDALESEVEENMLPEICSCGYRFEASETICPNCGKKVEEDG